MTVAEPTREWDQNRWAIRFFTIWTGQTFSLLGSGVVQFALVWWLTLTTGSATALAGATLVATLPQIVLGPFAGPLVDRWNRRVIMIVADGIIALATLGLIGLYSIGAMQVWHIYAAMLIRAAATAFHLPSMQASTALMVPKAQLSRVAGLNQTLHGVTSIASPALGALLLSLFELRAALAVDVVTAAIAILPLLFIAIPQPPRREAAVAGRSSFGRDLREGVQYVRGWPGLMAILVMAMLINFLLTPAYSLLALLVKDQLRGDAGLLATIEALFGIGVIAGGVILGAWGGFRRRIVTAMMGLIGLGVGCILLGLTPAEAVWIAIIGALLGGAMESMTNGSLGAVLQAAVAPEMMGRVMSLITSLATAMTPIGLLFAGPISDALGVRVWYVVGGGVCALMGVAGFFMPVVMRVEDQRAPEESEMTATVEQFT
jgi:DHA3 family macrolide efflux protein-like MFS transporter